MISAPAIPATAVRPSVRTASDSRAIRVGAPEGHWEKRRRFRAELGLTAEAAETLALDPELSSLFEDSLDLLAEPGGARVLGQWLCSELVAEGRARGESPTEGFSPRRLAELVDLVRGGTVSARAAKALVPELWGSGERARSAAERRNLVLERDSARLAEWVRTTLDAHPEEVALFRAGKRQLIDFLVGRTLDAAGGRADPRAVRDGLLAALDGPPASRP